MRQNSLRQNDIFPHHGLGIAAARWERLSLYIPASPAAFVAMVQLQHDGTQIYSPARAEYRCCRFKRWCHERFGMNGYGSLCVQHNTHTLFWINKGHESLRQQEIRFRFIRL